MPKNLLETIPLINKRFKLSKKSTTNNILESFKNFLINWIKKRRKKIRNESWIKIPVENAKLERKYSPPNILKSQKYDIITFIPMVLYEQFKHFFNLYFLFLCITQLFPAFQVGYLFTYISPLIFVLSICLIKELTDELKRYYRDREVNSQKYIKIRRDGTEEIKSYNIKVGDIILVDSNQIIPADMIFLKTIEKNGMCFLRTDQLDGETDWKLRVSLQQIQKIDRIEKLLDRKIEFYVETPHLDIHKFQGFILDKEIGQKFPITEENTLWANTVLASSRIYGFVIYTGAQTRAAISNNKPKTKIGKINKELDMQAMILFILSLSVSIIMTSKVGLTKNCITYVIKFFILFSGIIPMSLRVNIDLARILFAIKISSDNEIEGTIVRNTSLLEELARVGYLLSDKTGTLTMNTMEMKRLNLGTISYDAEASLEIKEKLIAGAKLSNEIQNSNPQIDFIKRGKRDISLRIYDIVLALALCHNVTPKLDNGKITYQAASPDEIAILNWAQAIGIELEDRKRDCIYLKSPNGSEKYEILYIFPFTSEKKRMGIIVKEPNGNIKFYLKGSDSVLLNMISKNDWLQEECENMAREGLRTLVIAQKKLKFEDYKLFNEFYSNAQASNHDTAAKVQKIVSEYLESNMELLGITGVEDHLQDGVKQSLEAIKNAGIYVWMLTGDKVETGRSIALSSRLISRTQPICQITSVKSVADKKLLISKIKNRKDMALIIDGDSLQYLIDNFKNEFFSCASNLNTVIFCRCTPQQKADIAKILKLYTKKSICCIGDGGNDVSMIQAADIGIGIVGKEGSQASFVSDISVNAFSHICRLFFWHGRNSYKGTSLLSQFIIHRGIIISTMQGIFSALFYFAPIALYQGFLLIGYSTIFTMLPAFSLVLDRDINEKISRLYPELYKELSKARDLSLRNFFKWLLISIYQGSIMMLLVISFFEEDFFHLVAITFTSLILNELLMIAIQINTWNKLMIIAEILSIIFYLISLVIFEGNRQIGFSLTLNFWIKVSFITAVSFAPLFLYRLIRSITNPPRYTKLT